jgi:surface antigen
MVLAGAVMPVTGFAGGINPFPNDVDNLTKGEADAIKEALGKALATYKSGTMVDWTSPDSKRSGRVKIQKTFERNGKHCATVENRFTNGNGNTYSLPFCQLADGSWKVSF